MTTIFDPSRNIDDALFAQHAALSRAIELLQAELDRVASADDGATWRDVAETAMAADIAKNVVERLAA